MNCISNPYSVFRQRYTTRDSIGENIHNIQVRAKKKEPQSAMKTAIILEIAAPGQILSLACVLWVYSSGQKHKTSPLAVVMYNRPPATAIPSKTGSSLRSYSASFSPSVLEKAKSLAPLRPSNAA